MTISRSFLFFVAFLLSVMMSTAVLAGDRIVESGNQRMQPLTSSRFVMVARGNPWALPQTQQVPAFPRYYDAKRDNPFYAQKITPLSRYNNYPSGENQYNKNDYTRGQGAVTSPDVMHGRYPDNPIYNYSGISSPRSHYGFQVQPRYVTPAILESIKKQQMRSTQQIPSPWQQKPYRKPDYRQYNPSSRYGKGYSSGNRYNRSVDPALSVTPGTLLDESLLDGNAGLPLTPDAAALGGISPLNTNAPLPPELSGNRYYGGSSRYFDPMAFNPSSMFGPFDNFAQ